MVALRPSLSKRKYVQPLLLALVLLLGLLVRVGRFPHVPPGFNQDEAASAYESFALAETGQDKWGNVLPAYFPAWGSGQNVLLAYLSVPVVKVLGLSILSARLVPLLLGLLTLPLFYYCLRPLGRFPALLGTLLLAVAPWHFMLTHWALESNLVPFFMLLGCTALIGALRTQRRRWIIPSLVPFALSLYAYGTTVVVLPGLFLLVFGLCFRQVWAQRGSWLLALGLFIVVAAPFLLFFVENYLVNKNLAWTDSLFFSTPLLPATRMSQVAASKWTDIVASNWRFVASGFDDGSNYNVLAGFKPLLSFTLPGAALGLVLGTWKLVRRRGRFSRSPRNLVLLVFAAWALASLGLFFSVELNVNRFNHFYLPCMVLAVWAINLVINSFNASVSKPALRLIMVSWLLVEGGLAIHSYLADYPNGPIRGQFNEGLGEAFTALEGQWGLDQALITGQMPLPYVYALFYLRYPPAQFQHHATVRLNNGVYEVRRFGRYIFTPDELDTKRAYCYLSRPHEFAPAPGQQQHVMFTNEGWEVGIMSAIPK